MLKVHRDDNVATALSDVSVGSMFVVDGERIVARSALPFGHKVALRFIARGAPVIKYGQPIGLASQDIASGEHVHTHNLVTVRGVRVTTLP